MPSSAATLTVATITSPTSETVIATQSATFTASTTDLSATIQWQVSVNGGPFVADTTDSGNQTGTLTVANTTAAQSGNQYRAVFTNGISGVPSSAATLTVATITAPIDDTVTVGNSGGFTASCTDGTATIQWQVSVNGGPFVADTTDSGNQTGTLTVANTTINQDQNQYRAVFTNSLGSVASAAATLTVVAPAAPIVTQQPTDTTVNAGQTATFTAAASGAPAPTVQWQVSTDGGATFTNITGATSTTFSIVVVATNNGSEYRAVFTNSQGSATSSTAVLTVDFAPTVTHHPVSVTGATGQVATFTASATGNPLSVQWQVSTNGGATFTAIPGATSTKLSVTISAGENGYQYQAVFTNSLGTATSDNAVLTVIQAKTPVFHSLNHATFVAGTSTNFTVMTTGSPTAALSLIGKLPTGVTFIDNGNGTATLGGTPAIGTAGTHKVTIFAFNGKTASQTFTVSVNQAPVITVQPTSQTVMVGAAALFTASASALPAARVQWQMLAPGASKWKNVAGAVSTTLRVGASLLNNGYQFRAVFTNSLGSAISNIATLTVYKAPAVTSASHAIFRLGVFSSFTITTSASPVATLSVIGGLPNGLTLTINATNGQPNGTATISGIPDANTAGTYTLIIVADNALGDAIQTFTLTIK